MRLLHEIITCIQAWNDAEDFEWRQGNDEKRRHGSVSGHLKRLLSLVREQPFPDTFPLRACLAYESSFQNESVRYYTFPSLNLDLTISRKLLPSVPNTCLTSTIPSC